MPQNGHFPKFSKIDFSITVQDMKMGVGPGENTSLGHVLKWLRHTDHSNCKNPPAIFRSRENRRFLPLIWAETQKSTLWSTPVDQNFCRKIWPKACPKRLYLHNFHILDTCWEISLQSFFRRGRGFQITTFIFFFNFFHLEKWDSKRNMRQGLFPKNRKNGNFFSNIQIPVWR